MARRVRGQLIEALLDGLPEACIGADRSGRIRFINTVACELFGVEADTVIEKELWDVLPINDFTRAFSNAVKDSDPSPSEQVMVLPPDRVFVSTIFPVESPDGRNSGVVAYLRDMSAVQKIEKGLDQVLSDVTQQLRLPLTAIKGYVETLLEGALQSQEVTRRFLQVINDETNRLARVIMSLEEAQGGEPGQPERSLTDLVAVVRAACKMFNQVAAEKNLALQVQLPESLSPVTLDAEGFKRVVINLVDNAVKCTGLKGYGWVRVTAVESADAVEVVVSDCGVGIAPEELERVFERFYRVTQGPAAELGGTGLGLAVAREIVEQHGGTLTAHSELGQGATFTVRLPR